MAALLMTVALGHMPIFNPESELTIKAEPSHALYLRRPTTITVDYKAGDYMYVLLLKSQKQGQWRSGSTVDAGIEDQTVCTSGSAATDSHAKVHSPGDTIYEPFAEGEPFRRREWRGQGSNASYFQGRTP